MRNDNNNIPQYHCINATAALYKIIKIFVNPMAKPQVIWLIKLQSNNTNT